MTRALSVLAGAAALAGTFYATPALASASAAKTVVLWGDGVAGLLGSGLAGARFGQTETVAIHGLDAAFGSPKSAAPAKQTGHCDTDGVMQWPDLTGYFNNGRFVGYSTLSPTGRTLSTATVVTLEGLRVGDTLTEARQLYGSSLRTSTEQGGSWFAKTAYGTLEGYLTAELGQTPSVSRIMSIEAGAVGCPAATP